MPDAYLDPQITLGAVYMPAHGLSLEANLDLLGAGPLLNGYDIHRFSMGGECDPGLVPEGLGAHRNLASSWKDWEATPGVSMDFQ